MTPEEVRAVWDALMFYNYVPEVVGTGPRVRPTTEQFIKGRESFRRVIEDHKVEAVLVCGHDLWGWVLAGLPEKEPGDPASTPFQRIGAAVAARMRHPSSFGFDASAARAILEELLRRVQANKAVPTD